jgi:hypothetical protein
MYCLWHAVRYRSWRMADPPKLLDRVRQAVRLRHYSRRTEQAYVGFLSALAGRGVSASTQNQALSAVLFLFEVVLGQRLGWMNEIVRAQRPARLPVVLSREEVSSRASGREHDDDLHARVESGWSRCAESAGSARAWHWAPLNRWASESESDTLQTSQVFPRHPDLPIPSPRRLSLNGKP